MKFAVSFPGSGYTHLTDEVYDLPQAIYLYQKSWHYNGDTGKIIYGAIFAEVDTEVIDVYDERLHDVFPRRVASDECYMVWDRYPPEGIYSAKLAVPRGIYKLPPDDTLMSDDERRAWIKKRLEELKIEY